MFKRISLFLAVSLVAGAPAEAQDFSVTQGACGVLDDELTSAAPALFATDAAVDPCGFVEPALSSGGATIRDAGTGGGSSLWSEVAAFEFLELCENAQLLKTETEISYDSPGPLTDALVELDGIRMGLSVTRGITFPFDQPLSTAEARARLEDKLQDIQQSTANVSAADQWQKQVLLVLTPLSATRGAFENAWAQLDAATQADTVVWILQTDDQDGFIYDNSAPQCDTPPPADPVAVPALTPWLFGILGATLLGLGVRRLHRAP